MSDLLHELRLSVVSVRASSSMAMQTLRLIRDEFAWFSGEIRYPMEPQRILPESKLKHDSYASHLTCYGGLIAQGEKCGYGYIRASIAEPLTGGKKHRTGRNSLPHPYISRLLTVNNDIVVVDTPTTTFVPEDGPMVVEGMGYDDRYRQTTVYHVATGIVAVKTGKYITDGQGSSDDRTIEQAVSTLSPDISEKRLRIMINTLKAASDLLRRIATQDIKARIEREVPRVLARCSV